MRIVFSKHIFLGWIMGSIKKSICALWGWGDGELGCLTPTTIILIPPTTYIIVFAYASPPRFRPYPSITRFSRAKLPLHLRRRIVLTHSLYVPTSRPPSANVVIYYPISGDTKISQLTTDADAATTPALREEWHRVTDNDRVTYV